MKRINDLIWAITAKFPDDQFFSDFDLSCKISKDKKALYFAYERALGTLDLKSWKILKAKALQHYKDHRKGQLKQGFFNQLNEAFAYQHLVTVGASAIQFVPEGKKSTPDLSYVLNGVQMHCEVKSLGISNDEIARQDGRFADDNFVYASLSEGFINKFCDAVSHAKRQIEAFATDGLVYIMITPDDFTLEYYSAYRQQLINTSIANDFSNLFIQIGIRGDKQIAITNPQ
ncbi:MAG: hypothetical protein ACI8PB_004644 [Desulforhopalus sp.]|jgi:hypothetical protein